VRDGGEPTPRQIALGRIAAAGATEAAASVTRTVNTLDGGSSIYSRSPFQRGRGLRGRTREIAKAA
jgi:hypothetical protein